MKIDYAKKARVIASGLPSIHKAVSKSLYLNYHPEKERYGQVYPDWACYSIIEQCFERFPDEWKESMRINHAEFERNKRLSNRIQSILEQYNAVFLTLTFTDDTLRNTSQKTRRTYVTRFLKRFSVPYVANVDFGKKNGREHYHAVLATDNVDYKLWHEYGAIKGERIIVRDGTCDKLGKYVSKLTNHAIKETAKRNAMIYSR